MLLTNAEKKKYRLDIRAMGAGAEHAARYVIEAASIEEARIRANLIANDFAGANPEMSVIICMVSEEAG